MKSEQTREKIMDCTIELLEEVGGDTDKITIRNIAARADIAVGLINHYFGSKEELIAASVQKVIRHVVVSFHSDNLEGMGREDLVIKVACEVMNFLMKNPQISKVSILDDLKHPASMDNTMSTVKGFAYCMSGGEDIQKYMKKSYHLVCEIQMAFLRIDVIKETLGIDLFDLETRNQFIANQVRIYMEGES